jgi:hypothetical protein
MRELCLTRAKLQKLDKKGISVCSTSDYKLVGEEELNQLHKNANPQVGRFVGEGEFSQVERFPKKIETRTPHGLNSFLNPRVKS